ncbi:hypothetical protein [Ollibium composti]|uniref:Uncharacterized protein n=1 Tax=Ollibium composti TaxID=2675109 RepID=A0ABY2QA66_9HYPH|nr:hypothetical protein [Mesorhizobium composti]THF58873.1 hypothetical protein E6C48_04260 [Mesorhizobium composti]
MDDLPALAAAPVGEYDPDLPYDPDLTYDQWDDDEKERFARSCRIAMRLALEEDEAPSRCPGRTCRREGRCHVRLEDSRLVCLAGPMPPQAVRRMIMMMSFLHELGKSDT